MPGFSSSYLYECLRVAFMLGSRVAPILQAIDAEQADARVLDLGCGFGNLAPYFNRADYTGVDLDPDRIQWAKSHRGESSRRRFLCGDVTRLNLPDQSFDKAIAYGILHHLSDSEASGFFGELKRVVKGPVVFSDPVFSRFHPVNNFLCRHDLGHYVRTEEGYLKLVGSALRIKESRTFWARNGLSKYFLVTAETV